MREIEKLKQELEKYKLACNAFEALDSLGKGHCYKQWREKEKENKQLKQKLMQEKAINKKLDHTIKLLRKDSEKKDREIFYLILRITGDLFCEDKYKKLRKEFDKDYECL